MKLDSRHMKLDPGHIKLDLSHMKLDLRHMKLDPGHMKLDLRHIKLDPSHTKLGSGHLKPGGLRPQWRVLSFKFEVYGLRPRSSRVLRDPSGESRDTSCGLRPGFRLSVVSCRSEVYGLQPPACGQVSGCQLSV